MNKERKAAPAAVCLTALALLASGCASTTASTDGSAALQTGSSDYGAGDITDYCPDEPTKVAYAKGSNNTWAQITLAEIKDEASKCETITDVIFTDAQGNQQQAVSDLNGLVAQGVKAIVIQPEFGRAQIPSIAAATQAGVGIVPLISDPGGIVGTDYPDAVLEDPNAAGAEWAKWLDATVGKGTVAFLGGTPGAASSSLFFEGFKKALKKYPDLELVSDSVIDTNWDAGQKKRVVSGLLAQHGRIDALVSDYSLTDTGVIDAYNAAGLEPPALTGLASGNANGCQWEKENFPYMTLDETTTFGRIALRKALAAAQGMENDEPSMVKMPKAIDTEAGTNPKCLPDLPPDADLTSKLSPEQLKSALGQR
ncbi:substrate-binding domain-containing protein [Arthrobacter zhaoguopingii]|uniref:substrate-binding domain-containing protein n=1 Tax=Arthrobacter zhaoguopingii TaxID=2681491 RepID=UPI00135A8644|nr:substrate-binding domain-containing protein [Arthrobacter zhaoguopingii]